MKVRRAHQWIWRVSSYGNAEFPRLEVCRPALGHARKQ